MSAQTKYDAAVVGSGIMGLASAYHLAKAGLKVAVFEAGTRPVGASIRNFGMVWPVGQPPGEIREAALESRAHWLEALEAAGIWRRECGSLHLAYAEDELEVMDEFVQLGARQGYRAAMITADEALQKSPRLKSNGLLGAMWNPEELCVFPREVVAALPEFLQRTYGVEFFYNGAVTRVEKGALWIGDTAYTARRIFVCPGNELRTLFPELLALEDIRLCKLQMLRAKPKDPEFRTGPHLCAGLTLIHYANFQICPSLEKVKRRYERDMPQYVEKGIHLLVSQHSDGCLTIGDSHEYSGTPDPFLSEEIDELMLSYLDTFLPVDQLNVVERWHGVYAKHFGKPYTLLQPHEDVAILAGIGGTGMTLSFGVTARVLREIGWTE